MSANSDRHSKFDELRELVVLVVEVVVIVVVLRTFVVQAFNIPSASMEGTIRVGDFMLVTKYSYGYSRHSFPFSLAPFSGRVWAAEPERGDVVVFRNHKDEDRDYVKRVIGLPGDRIQMINSVLHINGQPVRRERVEDFIIADDYGRLAAARQFREYLPNGRSYLTLDARDDAYRDTTEVFLVPAGHYFMMGDNRDNSTDSRYPEHVGYVPFEALLGRARIVFFSVERGESAWMVWRWPWSVRWERIGTIIR